MVIRKYFQMLLKDQNKHNLCFIKEAIIVALNCFERHMYHEKVIELKDLSKIKLLMVLTVCNFEINKTVLLRNQYNKITYVM